MTELSLPPLFAPLATAGADPLAVACAEARRGCDAGLVPYDIQPHCLRAALVFAPEVSLREAAVMLPLCGVGFQNALGALAPPEVSVHLDWTGAIRVNGAVCGRLALAAEPSEPGEIPDWLVVALTVDRWSEAEHGGLTPGDTTLYQEGCAEVEPASLIEAWVRHTLVWLDRWLEDGNRPLYAEWRGMVHGLDEVTKVGDSQGVFIGVDEGFGMLLQSQGQTRMIPLTDLVTEVP